MVKVKDESEMAEPKPTNTSSTLQSTVYYRKSRAPHTNNNINSSSNNNNNNHQHSSHHYHHHHLHHHHHHQQQQQHPLYQRYHLSHCTTGEVLDGSNSNNGSTSPAKFCLGPGFEPQTQQSATSGGNNNNNNFGAGPSQSQNNEHVVFFHVNPGVSISLQIGDNIQVLSGKSFFCFSYSLLDFKHLILINNLIAIFF